MKKMQELFDESFNEKYKNYDSVDKVQMQSLLLIKALRNFYLSVGLLFIYKFLQETTKK